MQSIFILGGSALQVPAIKKAKEYGLYVYVLDFNPNAVGIKYADVFLEISTIDKEEVLKAAEKYKPDFIITSTSDMPVRTVAWVNKKLGKQNDISYQDALAATDKSMMRKRMYDNKVPIPKFYVIENYEEFQKEIENMPQRFVVKPADNSASRGVILVDKKEKNNYKGIYDFSKEYSRNGKILIEEYMEGPEVSVEAITINDNTHIISITDKLVTKTPFFVEIGHTEPSRFSNEIQEQIKEVALMAIRAINIHNGATHTEIKITEDGIKLVEIAARLGGDFITSKLVPLSTGIDMLDIQFKIMLNKEIEIKRSVLKGAAIRFLYAHEGMIKSIEEVEEVKNLKGIYEVEMYKKVGDKVEDLKNSSDRIGHIIAIGKDADEASQICDEALKKIKINLE